MYYISGLFLDKRLIPIRPLNMLMLLLHCSEMPQILCYVLGTFNLHEYNTFLIESQSIHVIA